MGSSSMEQRKLMLRISDTVYSQVRKHGEETYPHECCGVLLGQGARTGSMRWRRRCARAIRAPTRPTTAITLRPRNWSASNARPGSASLDIVGFYHSHPDHPARWSPTDFNEAHWLGCSYVITSVETWRGGADQLVFPGRRGRG